MSNKLASPKEVSQAFKQQALREEAMIQLFRDGWPMWKIAKVMGHEQIFIENCIREVVGRWEDGTDVRS